MAVCSAVNGGKVCVLCCPSLDNREKNNKYNCLNILTIIIACIKIILIYKMIFVWKFYNSIEKIIMLDNYLSDKRDNPFGTVA